MNASTIRAVGIACTLLTSFCQGQQLQILRPDGEVFESIKVGNYLVVELPDRFQSTRRYQGQLMQAGRETITMAIRSKFQEIPISDIRAVRRVSRFGAWARRSARIIIPLAIASAGNITGDLVKGGTQTRQILVPGAASLGAGAIAYLLLHIPPLKKADKGYTFRGVD